MGLIASASYVMLIAMLAILWPKAEAGFPEAFARWFVGIPASLVALLSIEWLGTKALGFPFWLRMPSSARIALLVVLVVALVLVMVATSVWWSGKNAA